MIVAGKPEIGLQKHQQEAYKAVEKAFEEGNKASVVIPTGCGKSFISLQLMENNKDKKMLFMAPTQPIKDQMYRYIAKYIVGEEPTEKRSAIKIAEEHFPNLKIILYPTLLRMKKETMEKLQPEIIIMDELHRTGADKWGSKIDELLKANSNAKILGLTATPDRMDDKNVVDELFNGKIDYELTLVEAIRKGIVNPPSYVKCDYALRDELETIQEAIEACPEEETKKELQEKYNKMRRIVEQADGIPELFEKNLTKKDGKYIVFCKDKDHMEEMMEASKTWFRNIDMNPEIYSVYSKYKEKTNKERIKQFEESKSEHLKLLFSVDMLNEGLHVEDISGVIMLRPTESRIIYLQQLGRALSSDTTREKTIVFDLVNNYLKNNLDAEINRKEKKDKKAERENSNDDKKASSEWEYEDKDIDIFRIQGETKEFLELFEAALEILGRSAYLVNARKIEEWSNRNGRTPRITEKDEEEKKLGRALANIRTWLKSDKEVDEAEAKEEVRKIIEELDAKYNENKGQNTKLVNARKIEEWSNRKGRTPSKGAKDEEEKKLGNALGSIRQWLKSEKEAEGKEEIRKIIEELDTKYNENRGKNVNLVNARKIEEWSNRKGRTPSSAAKDEEEKKLAKALSHIRKWLKSEKEAEGKEEIRKIIEELDAKYNENVYLVNARKIAEWSNREGRLPSKGTEADEEEKKLGNARQTIRKWLKSEKEAEGKEEVRKIIEELDEKYNENVNLVNARKIAEWSNINGRTPRESAKDEEEKKLGHTLGNIRTWLKSDKEVEAKEEVRRIVEELDAKYNENVNLVNALKIAEWSNINGRTPRITAKDEEEKKLGKALSYIRTRLKSAKEAEGKDEIRKIIEELDTKYNENRGKNVNLVNARKIEEWSNINGRTPRQGAKAEEEKKLASALNNIRKWLKSDKEAEGKEEVRKIIEELDGKYNKKRMKLQELIEEDNARDLSLDEAKKLESDYTKLASKDNVLEKEGESIGE